MRVQLQTPTIECVAGVPCLRLSLQIRDDLTSITPDSLEVLIQALSCLDHARLVLIEGNSASFCQRIDLEPLIADHSEEILAARALGHPPKSAFVLDRYALLLDKSTRVPIPVIVLIDDPALGSGVGLAAVADLVLASPTASFALPEAIMGLISAVVFPYLARRIGVARARVMALGLHRLTAQATLEWGLVDEVVSDVSMSALHLHVRRFSRMVPHAIAAMKALVPDHVPAPADYVDAAISSFCQRSVSQETRLRLQRFAMGETPWLEESPG